jgi:hypothetical protein
MINLYQMTPQDVVDFFGSRKEVAKAVNVTQAAISLWFKKGFIHYEMQCTLQIAAERSGKKSRRRLIATRSDLPKKKAA